MQHLKIIFSLSVIFILTILNSDAQINQDKPVKTWNSNGLNASPAAKVPANVDLGQTQRTETIAKMEKQEKEKQERLAYQKKLMQNPEFLKMLEAEADFERTAAFGSGVKLVNVVTGERFTTK
jgi:uncharacterized protein YfaP (DUF2135 family)